MFPSESFPELLRGYRRSMGWTQRQLAKRWDYSFGTISSWERGIRNPSGQEIPRLASLLGMKPEDLSNCIAFNRLGTKRLNKQEFDTGNEQEVRNISQIEKELDHIHLNRTEFTRHFSYPRMFENASTILAVGISLNAIAMSYSTESIIDSIIENKCRYILCFLDPDGQRCAEREREENSQGEIISKLTRINISFIEDIRKRIDEIDPDAAKRLEIMIYDLVPRYNIYMVDDSIMTLQFYAYGRGEDTPTFVMRRYGPHGLFDFYASVARYILKRAKTTSS